MSLKHSKFSGNKVRPVVGKLSITEEAIRKSPFIIKKTEQAMRTLKENPFPTRLSRSK
ncbi:hypothetical protein [Chitinophaga sp.]|uniref:hypothetical protein n=1 Tax=Chitinophaga sp. TaxID=1869181 RepID=UPI0031D25B96